MPRKRSPHPGVVIRPARPEQYQKAQIRFTDPDSGKQRYETLPDGCNVKDYAKRKSVELANRCLLLKDGAPKLTGGSLGALVKDYFEEAIVRDSTAEMYGYSTKLLLEWGGPKSADDLTLAELRKLRTWIVKLPGRGPHTVNRDLRTVHAVLEHSRKAGRTPRLSAQDIGDGLQRIKAPTVRKDYCANPAGVLKASIAVDPWFGAYVAVLLLTGMRANEALVVTAGDVDFPASLVRLAGKDTKTGAWRDVELGWTPAGHLIFHALVEGKPAGAKLFGPRTTSYMREKRRKMGIKFDFQQLRRTTSTYLCSMQNVGLWRAAKSLGHHPEIARKHYAGVVQTSETVLERALGIDGICTELAVTLSHPRGDSLPKGLIR